MCGVGTTAVKGCINERNGQTPHKSVALRFLQVEPRLGGWGSGGGDKDGHNDLVSKPVLVLLNPLQWSDIKTQPTARL